MRAATGLALLKRAGCGRCEGFATPDLFHRGRRQLDRSSKASLATSNLVRVRVGIRVRCKCGSPRCLGYSLGRLLDAPAGEGAPPDGRQVDLEQRGAISRRELRISRRELREPPLLRVGDTLRASVPLLAWSGFGLGPGLGFGRRCRCLLAPEEPTVVAAHQRHRTCLGSGDGVGLGPSLGPVSGRFGGRFGGRFWGRGWGRRWDWGSGRLTGVAAGSAREQAHAWPGSGWRSIEVRVRVISRAVLCWLGLVFG